MSHEEPEPEWHYYDEVLHKWSDPVTLDEIDALVSAGKLRKDVQLTSETLARRRGSRNQPIAYHSLARVKVNFNPTLRKFLSLRAGQPLTVFSGPNNCGKTLLLKQIFWLSDENTYLAGCNRYSHVDVLNTRQIDENTYRGYHDNYVQNYYLTHQNVEENHLKLEQVIAGLTDAVLENLFAICGRLLGNTFTLKQIDHARKLSSFYVDMDGQNLRYASSGTRLLMTILGIMFDDRVTRLLIDEPELGLSPKIQTALAKFLCNAEERKRYCPHLKEVFLATHSHLFLDRNIISNNWVVSKTGDQVNMEQCSSIGEFHRLQFNLLGNELEAISFPSAILIVEGESDVTFMSKVTSIHLPDRRVSIVRAGGDGEVQKKLDVVRETFGTIDRSPYRDRLFVVLDQRNSVRLDRLGKQGVKKENIIVWAKNGIEHYYPLSLVAQAFQCNEEEVKIIDFESDPIEFNGLSKSKKELAQFVSDRLTSALPLDDLLVKLLDSIKTACA